MTVSDLPVPERINNLREICEFYLLAKGWEQHGAGGREWTQREMFCARLSLGKAVDAQVRAEEIPFQGDAA